MPRACAALRPSAIAAAVSYRFPPRQRPALQAHAQCLAFEQLHHRNGHTIDDCQLVNRADIWMRERSHRARLGLETASHLGVRGNVRGHDLQRHVTAEPRIRPRYTTPMPPDPIGSTISYWASRLPADRDMVKRGRQVESLISFYPARVWRNSAEAWLKRDQMRRARLLSVGERPRNSAVQPVSAGLEHVTVVHVTAVHVHGDGASVGPRVGKRVILERRDQAARGAATRRDAILPGEPVIPAIVGDAGRTA